METRMRDVHMLKYAEGGKNALTYTIFSGCFLFITFWCAYSEVLTLVGRWRERERVNEKERGEEEEEEEEKSMEWEKQGHHHHHQQKEELEQNGNGNGTANGGVLYVKVMTDAQMEILRKQISVYATICEQLVEMHKSLTSHQDLAGVRLGNLYCDPLMTSTGHKITARQRWTPTPVQLQILERIFDQGYGTPSKQKIKEITADLSQHGQISETNVYNWFQNRRARSKRKQLVAAPNNPDSEVETEVESPKDKKTKSENFLPQQNPASRAEDLCFQNPEISSGLHFLDQHTHKEEAIFPSDGRLKPTGNLSQVAFYAGNDHQIGKMEVPGCYNPYQQTEDYSMTG